MECDAEERFQDGALPGTHYCTRTRGHTGKHLCPCGHSWGDVNHGHQA